MSNNQQYNSFVLPLLVTDQSPRQSYVFDLIFKQILGIDYQVFTDYIDQKHLSYGLGSDFCIPCTGYLYENNIDQPVFENVDFEDKIFPFGDSTSTSFLPFDAFAACFYILSRQEEYNSSLLDKHGRYKHQNSWLTQFDWLKTPIVNYIAELIKKKIESYFGITIVNTRKFSVNPTFDIDNAYAYYEREKSLLPSLMKSVVKFDLGNFKRKILSKKNHNLDPFSTHCKIVEDVKFLEAKPIVFFLMRSGEMDSLCSMNGIKKGVEFYQNTDFELGIHPSYHSVDISSEIESLEQQIELKVKSSRFHFIKSKIPQSYQNLILNGITHDYSMGYANENGFRAGICEDFFWFDLEKNEVTELKITPFCFMDATYIFNLEKSVVESQQDISDLCDTVAHYKGKLSFVFHNESLSDTGVYEGWGKLWDSTLEKLSTLHKLS